MLLACVMTEGQQPPPEQLAFKDRPEAWAMKYYASVLLFAGAGPAPDPERWSWEAGVEFAQVPRLSEEERRVGFNGRKVEDLNKVPLLVRPTFTVGLPYRFSLSLSYVPPIRVFDAKTSLYAASLNRNFDVTDSLTLGLRGFVQYGRARGDFTCPRNLWQTSEYQEWGCDGPSNDITRSQICGGEFLVAYRIEPWRGLTPFAAVSYQYMDLEFEVNASTFGTHDNRRMITDGTTWAFGGGALYPLTEEITVIFGVRHAPLTIQRREQVRRNESLTLARLELRYAF